MVGIVDSGSGGLNIISACLKYYNEDFVYLIDNANCPYGDKPAFLVERYTKNNIKFLKDNFDLDFIIIACNTASSVLEVSGDIGVPILKTKPDLSSVEKTKYKTLLFATKNTLKHSGKIEFYKKNYKNLVCVCIKNLPKLIDNYLSDNCDKNKQKIVKVLKKRFFIGKKLKNKYKNVQFLSLGCTHFKHIIPFLNEIFNDVEFLECENDIAKTSKYCVRKSKSKSSIRVIMTKHDLELKQAILSRFQAEL